MAAASGVRRSALAGAAAFVLVFGGLAGCGADTATLAASAQKTLHSDVDAIREAAEDDPRDAVAAVSRFRTHVNDLVAAGELDPADALQLIAHAGRIESKLAAASATSPSPAKAAPTTTSREVAEPVTRVSESRPVVDSRPVAEETSAKAKGKDKGPGKGKGKGRGNH